MSKSNPMWTDPMAANLYEQAEQFTKPYAVALVKQAGLTAPRSNGSPLVIFDNACGTGVVSSVLHGVEGLSKDLELTCGDTSEPMVKYVQQKIHDKGWSGATAKVVDAQV